MRVGLVAVVVLVLIVLLAVGWVGPWDTRGGRALPPVVLLPLLVIILALGVAGVYGKHR